ncbi:thiamine-monophosphate kinase [Candidatus Uzinura diaspidicola str. ASNER]|uniref:Thiamine-monophosphate kinase n=1 Tax=Candidatus Uzinura diaspidicola str. ASNER TaxID=1133592 RepID=L7VJG7_9FLAO|nr:thiamine-monophosphate kinase [Candidatus Uzinura diaspidicola str. ASNER]
MFQERKTSTPLEKLGEFGIIKYLTQDINYHQFSSIIGIGDDAAVLDFKENKILVSTDLLIEGIHFNLAYTPLKHLGYKAVVVNISDIYAMNAKPTQITISIAVSNKFSLESLNEFYVGIKMACKHYKIDLIGGDTSSSNFGMIISMTAIGSAYQKDIVLRKGAAPNDLLVVSGDLGAAYLGLQILKREYEVFKTNPHIQPEYGGYEYVIQRQLKPEAPNKILSIFNTVDVKPSSMIDISDGLASEVLQICDMNNLGCRLFEGKLPIDPQTQLACEDLQLNPSIAVLSGGEDYELLFSISLKDYEKIKYQDYFSVIGYMTYLEEGAKIITKEGQLVSITAQGWDAFLKHA